MLFDLFLSFLGFPLCHLDFPESLGVNIDVEDDVALLLVEFVNLAPGIGVIDQEVLTVLLASEVDSTDIGVIVDDWENIDLKDVGVDFPEGSKQGLLELLFILIFWLD